MTGISSKDYREIFRRVLESGSVWRLGPFLPCRNAKSVEEMRHIAEGIVKMSDEELDRLRASLTPEQEAP